MCLQIIDPVQTIAITISFIYLIVRSKIRKYVVFRCRSCVSTNGSCPLNGSI